MGSLFRVESLKFHESLKQNNEHLKLQYNIV